MDEIEAHDAPPEELAQIERHLHARVRVGREQNRQNGAPEPVAPPDDDSSSQDDTSAAMPGPEPVVPVIAIGAGGEDAGDDGFCMAPDVKKVFEELGAPTPGCFACEFGRSDSVAVAFENWRKMEALMQEKLHSADTVGLCKALAAFFEKWVRKPANASLRDGEDPIPEWNATSIWIHIREHINDTGIRRHSQLEMVNTAIHRHYRWRLFKKYRVDGQTVEAVDERSWILFERMLNTYTKLTARDIKKAAFSWSGVGTPSEEPRSLSDKKKNIYLQNSARHNGTSHAARAMAGAGGSTVQGAGAAKKARHF
jgi:hypothetical protein